MTGPTMTRRGLLLSGLLGAIPLENNMPPTSLNKGTSVTLDGSGNGTAKIGPENNGPPNWTIQSVIWVCNQGVAPIPTVQVFQDSVNDPSSRLAVDYDGSFGSAGGEVELVRGQYLYVVFTGGNPGATAQVTVTGTQGR